MSKKLSLSLSLDLDNTWSYLKIHGSKNWEKAKSHFPIFIPRILSFLKSHDLKITFFIVGKDALEQKPYLQEIVKAGHQVGNHSFHHEPWMQKKSEENIKDELSQAHKAIVEATGVTPIGFRGPGFCFSDKIIRTLHHLNYQYDASILPTSLGPLARAYYLLTVKNLQPEEKEKRDLLFGSFTHCLLPNAPFRWQWEKESLLEIPVTTLPIIRTPIHLSYLLWLLQASKKLALGYLKSWIYTCKLLKVNPSLLLHPPDFFDLKEVPELTFFPAIQLEKERKIAFLEIVFNELKKHFHLTSLNDFVEKIKHEKLKIKSL